MRSAAGGGEGDGADVGSEGVGIEGVYFDLRECVGAYPSGFCGDLFFGTEISEEVIVYYAVEPRVGFCLRDVSEFSVTDQLLNPIAKNSQCKHYHMFLPI